MEKVIVMEKITKTFPGVIANEDIDFYAYRGEIVSLLGENGAGKTTLMKILYGLYSKTSGNIYIKGKKVEIRSPKEAIDLGIGMVHQHFTLVNPFTVVENIVLGMEENGFILELDKAREKVISYMDRYSLHVDQDCRIDQLSVGEKQRVEILKVLFRNADILILDEATAVLTPQEIKDLFKTLKILKSENKTIIFISHKLNEVLEISDRIVVLRDGKVVGETTPFSSDKKSLAKMMVGKDVIDVISQKSKNIGEAILEVKNLSVLSERGHLALKGISFHVKSNEILGIAGVSGNGQKELEDVLAGIRKPISGEIYFNGKNITGKSPKSIIDLGIGRIPEDRMENGIVGDLTIYENLLIERFDCKPYCTSLFLNYKEIRKYAKELVKEFDVRTPSINILTSKLSGGNIQKVILARIFSRSPKFLLASQATRGLDVGATEYIHGKLIEARERGCGILLISEDLDEIINLSDRILVLYGGEIMGFAMRDELTREDIGLMMTGTRKEALSEIS